MNNWKKFCSKISSFAMNSENDVEKRIADLFDLIFGWSEEDENLKRQVPIQIGHEIKRADIVLSKDDKKQIIIELKRPRFVPGDHEINQLYSYMCIEKVEYGIIANDKELWVYRCSLISTTSSMEEVVRIPFDPNDINGQNFASLLCFDKFSTESMEDFCKEKLADRRNESRADDLADILCSEEGPRIIKESLFLHNELSQEYSKDIIQKAVDKLLVCKADNNDVPSINLDYLEHGLKGNRFCFSRKGIKVGDKVVFIANNNFIATVVNDLEVEFEGQTYKLSPLARKLYERIGRANISGAYQGGAHFAYGGKRLIDIPDMS